MFAAKTKSQPAALQTAQSRRWQSSSGHVPTNRDRVQIPPASQCQIFGDKRIPREVHCKPSRSRSRCQKSSQPKGQAKREGVDQESNEKLLRHGGHSG